MSAAKKKNPLYVVRNDGNTIEEASNFVDMLVKKFGLEPVIEIFRSVIAMLSDQVGNYGFFLALQEFVDQIVQMLEEVKAKVQSVVPLFN